MKRFLVMVVLALTAISHIHAREIVFETNHIRMSIDERGYFKTLFDRINDREYLSDAQPAPLLSIRVNGELEHPSTLQQRGSELLLFFEDNQVEARIITNTNDSYISFELVDITSHDHVELVIWGPYPTTISETIGETVGVVRNKEFAIGIRALNVKTLGGYPDDEHDIEPSYNIFESGYYADMTDEWKNRTAYRGQTARVEDFGSVLQAYCRHRNKDRVIPNWGYEHFLAPAFDDGGVIGSKIALFGSHPDKVLEIIKKIELSEGLPHPTINGEWAKTSRAATASYLIIDFSEENLDRAIALTKKAGLEYLYHGNPFQTWGHFTLNSNSFPDNWESMRRCVDRAGARGVKLGIHTLTNFITPNDPYVSPVPDKRLARVGESMLTQDINASSDEIYIESPTFFKQIENSTLQAVVINNEIIRYSGVSESEPWRLLGCVRGAFNTSASDHRKGDLVGKLMDHAYRVFLSNAGMSEEIAITIARLMNETGLMQISFDGLEGVWSTGKGQYARSLFTKTWYDNLSPDLKGKVINDASNPSHFNWHINTRYNWGEPWYAGFRESQTYYRLMNQHYYQRNFLPAMLGWFNMTSRTSIEDTEWLLARAAGFDAGFAFNLNFNVVNDNGQSDAIFDAINHWESARMAGAFSEQQKILMKDIANEFHLEQPGPGEWNLYQYYIERYAHKQKTRQPGEPVFSTFEFDNPYHEQPLMFIIGVESDDDNKTPLVDHISLEINNVHVLEIPVKMEASQNLKLGSDGMLNLFDSNWNQIQTIDVNSRIPNLVNGKNKILIDAGFTGSGSSSINIEMKTIGPAELLGAEPAR